MFFTTALPGYTHWYIHFFLSFKNSFMQKNFNLIQLHYHFISGKSDTQKKTSFEYSKIKRNDCIKIFFIEKEN